VGVREGGAVEVEPWRWSCRGETVGVLDREIVGVIVGVLERETPECDYETVNAGDRDR
jgi:hypothetical protein